MTPYQTSGPFYPAERNTSPLFDLTEGDGGTAVGRRVLIRGKVLDESGRPLDGALVELWQACASGRYNHADDPNPAALDPHFRYWGRVTTNAFGAYAFRTIEPGTYPAEPGWLRPPHIHFKVTKPGYRELITQMYFAGHPLNEADLILDKVPRTEWGKLIVDFRDLGGDGLAGEFDLEMAVDSGEVAFASTSAPR